MVRVALVNLGAKARTGTLVLEMVVDGEKTLAVVPFSVMGARKAFVTWASPAPVQKASSGSESSSTTELLFRSQGSPRHPCPPQCGVVAMAFAGSTAGGRHFFCTLIQ